jgi:hypothetical protein
MSNDPGSAGSQTHAFYGSGLGTRLIDAGNYPPSIQDYLHGEEQLLASLEDGFSTLVEVGCMHGRYLEWAVARGKNYLGVDPVQPYIRQGHERLALDPPKAGTCRFAQGTAEEIDLVLRQEGITEDERPLLFFPFNSFGQARFPRPIVAALSRARAPFLICTYGTGDRASEVRKRYYDACGYADLTQLSDESGVRFVSSDGLHSAAYHPPVMAGMFAAAGLRVKAVEFSDVGTGYSSLQPSFAGG